jgi:hypothetical protein
MGVNTAADMVVVVKKQSSQFDMLIISQQLLFDRICDHTLLFHSTQALVKYSL